VPHPARQRGEQRQLIATLLLQPASTTLLISRSVRCRSSNGQEIGKGRMGHSLPLRLAGYAGMDIGRDNGGVVDRAYAGKAPFAFTGTIKRVVFDIKPHLSADDD
jgi:hypothetical protein